MAEREGFEISVDRKPFKWGERYITGAQVRGLVHEGADYAVYIKRPHGEDIPVGDDEQIDLEKPDNRHFLTIKKKTTEG